MPSRFVERALQHWTVMFNFRESYLIHTSTSPFLHSILIRFIMETSVQASNNVVIVQLSTLMSPCERRKQ